MGIILDLVLIAILILSIIFGYKRGLINVAFNVCAFIVALVITFILYNPITNLVINNTQIDENIKSAIIENNLLKTSDDNQTKDKDVLNKYVEKYVTDTANDALDSSARIVAEKIVGIMVAIILFIVVRILLILTRFIADGIASLPIIKKFNKLGGLLYGILSGLIIIYGILAILFFVISINNTGMVADAVSTSILSKFLSTHNIILNIIF